MASAISANKAELLAIANSVASEKMIDKAIVIEAMEEAIQKSARNRYGAENDIRAKLDPLTGDLRLWRVVEVVEEVEDYFKQVDLKAAQKLQDDAKIGDFIVDPLPPVDLGRIDAQSAKQVIFQKVRDAERERQFDEFKDRAGEVITGVIKSVEFGHVIVNLGRAEGVIRRDQQIPREAARVGERVRALITKVERNNRGPQIFLSRAHPDFMKKLFAQEVPEIYDGIIEIRAAARDPRTEPPQSPGPQPANASPGWCVLVTATVCPAQGMTHTVRWSPRVREKDYGAALQQWTAPSGGTALPVVVVENSGASLRGLRSATSEHARRSGQVEFVSFHDAQHDPTRGKGNAEYHSLLHALNRSQTLRRCTHVLKVTGRYFIENLDEALATLSPEVKLAVQSTPSPWTLWDGVVRSEVVGFANDAGLVQELFDGQHEGRGEPMERVLFLAARRLREKS